MPTYKFTSLNGVPFQIYRPLSTRRAETVYVIAPPKSGSVLLNNLIKALCDHGRLPYFDFEPQLFNQGIQIFDVPIETMRLLEKPGTINIGFRTPYLLQFIRRYRSSKKIFLIRDPRDMVVSFYYSMSQSHALPAAQPGREELFKTREEASAETIDEFVSSGKADNVVHAMRGMIRHISEFPNAIVFRYEEIIFAKRDWISNLAKIIGLNDVPDSLMQTLLSRFDIIPDKERPDQHIRQVTPGNFRSHLSPSTIQHIEEKFHDVIAFYNYS